MKSMKRRSHPLIASFILLFVASPLTAVRTASQAQRSPDSFDPRSYREPDAIPVNPQGGVSRPWVNWVRGMQSAAPFDFRSVIMDLFQRLFSMFFGAGATSRLMNGQTRGSSTLASRIQSDPKFRDQQIKEFKRVFRQKLQDLRSRFMTTSGDRTTSGGSSSNTNGVRDEAQRRSPAPGPPLDWNESLITRSEKREEEESRRRRTGINQGVDGEKNSVTSSSGISERSSRHQRISHAIDDPSSLLLRLRPVSPLLSSSFNEHASLP